MRYTVYILNSKFYFFVSKFIFYLMAEDYLINFRSEILNHNSFDIF